jgi:phenol/toluene 2-monooxygenase (NADH) P0/A0
MGRQNYGDALQSARADAPTRKYVRIIGSRLGRYVEFEFSINDQDLAVELILPFAAFDEFCELQNATLLPPDPAVADELERQAWGVRHPGPLRRVKDAADSAKDAATPDVN